jgi:hypothetical protein
LGIAAAAGIAGWLIARGGGARASAAPSFRRLSFLRGGIGNARFAPDGQTVIYGASATGQRDTTLFLAQLTGSEHPVDFPGDIPTVSNRASRDLPTKFAYSSDALGGPMTGGAPRALIDDGLGRGRLGSDGKDLAVARGEASRSSFRSGRRWSRSRRRRLSSFLPSQIAFWKRERGEWTLNVVDRRGQAVKTISSGWPSASGIPGWGADGRELWFTASKAGGVNALWATSLAGKPRQLVRVPGDLELYDVARGGRALLGHHTIIRSLRGLAPGESAEHELAWLDSSSPADLSADGTTVLITEDGEGAGAGPAVYLRTNDGAPASELRRDVPRPTKWLDRRGGRRRAVSC